METTRLPTSVAWLGYGGLIPFVALAILVLVEPGHGVVYRAALNAYGAVILSFVGALHWGFAMTIPVMSDQLRARTFVWSVVPALLAWTSYFLPIFIGAAVLILGFLAQYYRDQKLVSQVALPAWYLPLRLRLTIVASLSIAVGAYAVFFNG